MNTKKIEIKTKDGITPCDFFYPPQKGNRPGVIFYMDGIGIRPALRDMADRLAQNGYHVLLPNLYYRAGPVKPFDAATAFKEGPERDRLMSLLMALNNTLLMQDTGRDISRGDCAPGVLRDASKPANMFRAVIDSCAAPHRALFVRNCWGLVSLSMGTMVRDQNPLHFPSSAGSGWLPCVTARHSLGGYFSRPLASTSTTNFAACGMTSKPTADSQ